jgi:hypothetical protein
VKTAVVFLEFAGVLRFFGGLQAGSADDFAGA